MLELPPIWVWPGDSPGIGTCDWVARIDLCRDPVELLNFVSVNCTVLGRARNITWYLLWKRWQPYLHVVTISPELTIISNSKQYIDLLYHFSVIPRYFKFSQELYHRNVKYILVYENSLHGCPSAYLSLRLNLKRLQWRALLFIAMFLTDNLHSSHICPST